MRDRRRGYVSTGIIMPICVGAALFALTTWLGFHTPAGSRWHSWLRWPWWAEALSVLAMLASFIAMAGIDEARRTRSNGRDTRQGVSHYH